MAGLLLRIYNYTRLQGCDCWVHQNCVGLHYKKKENLDKVPFYCKIHGDLRNRSRKEPKASAKAKPKTKKKTQTKSKLAAIAAKKRMSNLQTSHDREIYI